jgi:hypothetical protein
MADDFVEEALNNYETGGFAERLAATPKGRGYHIRPHGQGVHDTTVSNRLLLIEAGVSETEVPSLFLARTAPATHDEAYFRFYSDPKIRDKFKDPEEYAMDLYAERARGSKYRIDEQTIAEGQGMIRGTRAGERCRTWGEVILCEADIHPTTQEDTAQMDEDTQVLYGEYRVTNKEITELGYELLALGVLKTIQMINLSFPRMGEVGYFAERRKQMGKNLDGRALRIASKASGFDIIRASIDAAVPEFFQPLLRKLPGISQAA